MTLPLTLATRTTWRMATATTFALTASNPRQIGGAATSTSFRRRRHPRRCPTRRRRPRRYPIRRRRPLCCSGTAARRKGRHQTMTCQTLAVTPSTWRIQSAGRTGARIAKRRARAQCATKSTGTHRCADGCRARTGSQRCVRVNVFRGFFNIIITTIVLTPSTVCTHRAARSCAPQTPPP